VTKSVTSVLVGLAIDHGQIANVNEPAAKLVGLNGVSGRRPNVEDLLTMRSGWDCGFEPKEARLFEMRRSADWIRFMFDLPTVAEPGTRWTYCSGNCHVLSAALTRVTGTNVLSFARRELFEPLGIRAAFWTEDPRGNNHGWGDLQLHPLDMAKLGQLFLQRGRWDDRQLISDRWVNDSTRAHVTKTSNQDGYGYYWWVKGADFPGMYEAVGLGARELQSGLRNKWSSFLPAAALNPVI
jgi:CubicO group peptidase (beta-lactamase class C family)